MPTPYERILSVTHAATQVELARILGIRQSSISSVAVRGESVPPSWLLTLFFMYRINPEWVLTGIGDRFVTTTDTPPKSLPRPELLDGISTETLAAELLRRVRAPGVPEYKTSP